MLKPTLADDYAQNIHVLQGVKQIGRYLNISGPTAHRWIKYHGLPAMKRPRGDWFTTKSLIDRWIEARGEVERRANGWIA